jgi:hypothetical protein
MTRHYVDTQDVQTAARLVTANLRLVVKIAYEYRRAYRTSWTSSRRATSASCRP